jgi:hypothetical protein
MFVSESTDEGATWHDHNLRGSTNYTYGNGYWASTHLPFEGGSEYDDYASMALSGVCGSVDSVFVTFVRYPDDTHSSTDFSDLYLTSASVSDLDNWVKGQSSNSVGYLVEQQGSNGQDNQQWGPDEPTDLSQPRVPLTMQWEPAIAADGAGGGVYYLLR